MVRRCHSHINTYVCHCADPNASHSVGVIVSRTNDFAEHCKFIIEMVDNKLLVKGTVITSCEDCNTSMGDHKHLAERFVLCNTCVTTLVGHHRHKDRYSGWLTAVPPLLVVHIPVSDGENIDYVAEVPDWFRLHYYRST